MLATACMRQLLLPITPSRAVINTLALGLLNLNNPTLVLLAYMSSSCQEETLGACLFDHFIGAGG
jgi:hypothetical protein